MSQYHPLRGPLALVLVMVHINPLMETPPMETEQRTLGDSVAILGEVNPPIVQGILMQITMSPTMLMTDLASVGEQATLTLRHMILLMDGRDAISWQKGCLSHLNLGSMAMCEFLNIQLRVFRSLLFTPITPRPDSELDVAERFNEPRGRMPPPREDYLYAYGGDSYRAGNSYMSRRDLAYTRSTDYYRPGYPEEGRWGSSFPLDDTSNWPRQRSPSTTSRPRGRSDCRDVSYERSLSGSVRSSRYSSPKHRSRTGASRRAPSPSSSSIRSSRERSKSPPRSRDQSRSSVRSSTASRSYTPEPPVRSPVQRSHPVGQPRNRRRGPRLGMRHADDFRDSVAAPFSPPSAYPNDDRYVNHPSLPLRPSPPYLASGLNGRQRISDRGFSSGTTQNRSSDSTRGEILTIISRNLLY